MPQPTVNNVHVNRPLTNVSIGYMQDNMAFAAGRVFPIVPVDKKSDQYYTFGREAFRNQFRPRASGAPAARTGFNTSTDAYLCKRYDLSIPIPDDVRANADPAVNLDALTTRQLTGQALLNREVNFATSYMTAGVWSIELTGVAATPGADEFLKWSDDASDPVADVLDAKQRVLLRTGVLPNKMTMSYDVAVSLKTNPAVIDRIKYSGGIGNSTPVRVTNEALAQVFEVDEIIISAAVVDNSEEDLTVDVTTDMEYVISSKVLLSYAPTAAGLMIPSAGYIFTWRGLLGNAEGTRVKRWRDENVESDIIEHALAYDMKKTSEAAALLVEVL